MEVCFGIFLVFMAITAILSLLNGIRITISIIIDFWKNETGFIALVAIFAITLFAFFEPIGWGLMLLIGLVDLADRVLSVFDK